MDIKQFDNPVVFFDNAIGDSFVALPALRALAQLAEGRLSLITCGGRCGKINFTIFRELAVKHIYGIDVAETERGKEINPDELGACLNNSDLFIYMNTWMPAGEVMQQVLSSFAPRPSIGFYKYMSVQIPYEKSLHSADLLFQFPLFFNRETDIQDFAYSPEPPTEVRRLVCQFRNKFPATSKLLIVHADTKTNKTWPFEYYPALLDRIMDTMPEVVVIFIGIKKPDVSSCKHVSRILRFEEALPFSMDWAFVSIADIFLGVDSVFLHIADLFHVPVVSLFGPSSVQEWGVRFSAHHRCVEAPSGNMEDITVDAVYNGFSDLMTCQPIVVRS
ncbi:glycosyltransferase family 9 protein [Chitinophaga varians]|uniref:Glycosyltransferase family 9 protein n=1 Tax=Chitinophaga varians TaxID=2202339 RepID=A0A847RNV7_9BACT|nr:glycosyltransferase family 9 protein [Chitinophaga varians]NLR68659.1 glycosyltransferase family 9 protein [Chitinophaga varians]